MFSDKFEFVAYVIDNAVYWTICTSSQFFYDSGAMYLDEFIAKFAENEKEQILKNANSEYDRIKPAVLEKEDEEDIEEDEKNGSEAVPDDEVKRYTMDTFAERIDDMFNRIDITDLLDSKTLSEKENNLADIFAKMASYEKAENNLLKQLSQDDTSEDTQIRRVFKRLNDKKVKNVTVYFDFGYLKIAEKVKTDLSTYWFMSTQKDSRDFAVKYAQPYDASPWCGFGKLDSFVPYITSIVNRGNVVYSRQLSFADVEKRQLYNAIYRFAKNYDYRNEPNIAENINNLIDKVTFEKGDSKDDMLSELYYTKGNKKTASEIAKHLIKCGYDTSVYIEKINNNHYSKEDMLDFIR